MVPVFHTVLVPNMYQYEYILVRYRYMYSYL